MVGPTATAIFHRSPLWLQDAATSAYGWKLRRARYGGEHGSALAKLAESDYASADALDRLQNGLLRETVGQAIKNVPYYRDKIRLDDEDVRSLRVEQLHNAFPPLPKTIVREQPARFCSEAVKAPMIIHTSGSTGSPLPVATTKIAIQHNYAFFARFLNWHGVSPFDESATFAGRMFVGPKRESQRQWRRNAAMHDTLYSSYHLTNDNIPDYVREMERRQPRYIDAYPSSIYRIASFIESEGIVHNIRPRVIITSSETLLSQQRELVERVFACPVRDQYGSAEMAGFFAECERGHLHIASEYGIVEIVDSQGTPLPPGQLGHLCLTGFINPAMPLIRYLIGDTARLSLRACDCGRASPVVDSIEGRTDDIIVTPTGRHVGRLDPAFKGVVGVKESQIVQTTVDRVVVKIVRDNSRNFDPAGLIENLQERLDKEMKISIEFVSAIPRETNGKFRSVKSMLAIGTD